MPLLCHWPWQFNGDLLFLACLPGLLAECSEQNCPKFLGVPGELHWEPFPCMHIRYQSQHGKALLRRCYLTCAFLWLLLFAEYGIHICVLYLSPWHMGQPAHVLQRSGLDLAGFCWAQWVQCLLRNQACVGSRVLFRRALHVLELCVCIPCGFQPKWQMLVQNSVLNKLF